MVMVVISFSSQAQNTKGDKPARTQTRTIQKSSKPAKARAKKSKGNKRIQGERKSAASRAVQSLFRSKARKAPGGDRNVKTDRPRVKSTSAQTARNNVYPQRGPFVNNPSRRPREKGKAQSNSNIVRRNKQNSARQSRNNVYSASGPYVNNPSKRPSEKPRVFSNNSQVKRLKRLQSKSGRANVYSQTGRYVNNSSSKPRSGESRYFYGGGGKGYRSSAWPPGKRRIGYNSASGSIVKRGRRNVYWGKFSKGERAITTDIAGRPLRAKNFRTPPLEIIPSKNPYERRTRKKEGAYQGTFRSGHVSAGNPQRAWRGDISGRPLRSNASKKMVEVSGRKLFGRKLSVSGKGRTATLSGSGYRTASGRGKSNQPIPVRAPGIGASRIERFIGKLKGQRPVKGGGSVSGKGYNNNGQPINVRVPLGGARMGTYAGNIKGKKKAKGGGSISGIGWNNGGNPVIGKAPSRKTLKMGVYQGSFKKGELSPGFGDQGVGFSGNMKARRPEKGGGSISGRAKNNRFVPIDVRAPRSTTAARVGTFQGNIKGRRPEKGGGSISGRAKNNRFQPIDVRAPRSTTAARVGTFQGNIKGRRPEKGGGSISGRAKNNGFQPIDVRAPRSTTAARVGTFQGNIKGRRPEKGGGSISGRAKNNRFQPINVKAPTGRDAAKVGTYPGNYKLGDLNPGFRNQGEEFTGFIKAKRPAKGGGSVSGKLWNNNGKPIEVRTPLAEDARAANYNGKIRLSRFKRAYVKNPNASEDAVKQRRPNKTVYDVAGLQVKVKEEGYTHNPNSSKEAIKHKRPSKTVKEVAGLQVKVRETGYTRNPNASEEAIKQKKPFKSTFQVKELQVRVKQGDYGRKPNAHKDALLGLQPGKNSVKASEYEGKMRVVWAYKHNPSSSKDATDARQGTKSFYKATDFQGRYRLTRNYRHNSAASKDALKVLAPGKAYAKVNNYQGNLKMKKHFGRELHPDAQFAHGHRDNVKEERTILMNIKLLWAKLIRKNNTQTKAVKEKVRRPRYDKKERELWKDLYD